MIDIMIDDDVAADGIPGEADIRRAVEAACAEAGFDPAPSLCIRFSGDAAVHALNREWRHKDCVTDILSFPMQDDGSALQADESLGDMILATPFTLQEAARLSLPVADHMLHLIVHGTLHLLGFDHIDDDEAEIMQAHEQRAMRTLGLHNPYPDSLYKEAS